MIRMTLLLMAGIVGAMLAWGDNEGLPQGSDSGSDVAATRAADSPGLLSRVCLKRRKPTKQCQNAPRWAMNVAPLKSRWRQP